MKKMQMMDKQLQKFNCKKDDMDKFLSEAFALFATGTDVVWIEVRLPSS